LIGQSLKHLRGVVAIIVQRFATVENWTADEIVPQAGRLALVTGGAGGVGYETALGLARAGADVIIADVREAAGREAAARIRPLAPTALIRYERLDLASLSSVSGLAGRLIGAGRPIDVLINAAGVQALPRRQVTTDGFEMQLAVNYLGHFALTAQLLQLLRQSRQARVVQVSSRVHRYGAISFEDLHGERRYRPWAAHCQSKLAMILFAIELQRRSTAHGWGLVSSSAHPGYTQTSYFANSGGLVSLLSLLSRTLGRLINPSRETAALPALFAATASRAAEPGGYYGPSGPFELVGPPGAADLGDNAEDEEVARRLWVESEMLTRVQWPDE
jgi:NAD(P)-dependent dehydrogenase (short-subunit alcohol dehydrogenase family)